MRISFKIFVASMLVALAVAVPASAQSVTQQGYTLRAGVTETSIQHNTPPAAKVESHNSGGGLPFTGLQLGLVAGVGIVLLGAGLTVRRFARPTQA